MHADDQDEHHCLRSTISRTNSEIHVQREESSALISRGRWSAPRKVSVVLAPLRGEDLETPSRAMVSRLPRFPDGRRLEVAFGARRQCTLATGVQNINPEPDQRLCER